MKIMRDEDEGEAPASCQDFSLSAKRLVIRKHPARDPGTPSAQAR
jgi:hypothetical protein